MFDFRDKAVLVTGAGAGIGEAVALAFAKDGAKVALNSVSVSGEAVAKRIQVQGYEAIFIRGDVSDSQDARRIVEKTVEKFEKIDVVVNCAGIVCGGNVEETDLDIWHRTMEVNVTGTFLICKYAMPYLRYTKGVIVNISSLVAVKGIANRAAYSASKGAVLSLSKAMAADYIKDGVRVNCVCPGTVLSPSLQGRIDSEPDPDQAMGRYVSRQPMGRLGTPEEIATAVLFAASSEAGFLDGAVIQIDGAGSL